MYNIHTIRENDFYFTLEYNNSLNENKINSAEFLKKYHYM